MLVKAVFMLKPLEARRKKTCEKVAAIGLVMRTKKTHKKNQFLFEQPKEYPL